MTCSPRGRRSERGSALIIALAFLSLFALMGTAYVKHVGLQAEGNNIELRMTYASAAAEAGVNATIGRIATILERGGRVSASEEFDLPVYGMRKTNAHPEVNQGVELIALEQRRAWANVSIGDESGKININHAPASVLRHLLGGDGATARRLAEAARTQPFISLDELTERAGLTEEQFAQLEPYVTVYTVVDHGNPAGYINLYASEPEVLGALFDLRDETMIGKLSVTRPKTLADLCRYAGDKNPATFNIPMDPNSPEALPPALTLTSRCFRLVSEGHFAYTSESGETTDEAQYYKGATARVEAVVLFDLDGKYEILKWSTQQNHLT